MSASCHQTLARLVGILRRANRAHHQVDVGDRHPEAFDELTLRPGLAKVVAGAADDDLAPVVDEAKKRGPEVEHLGTLPDDGQAVVPKRALQRRHLVELVQNDFAVGVALELDDDPQAIPVGLVADVADSLEPLLADQVGDLLQKLGLVHLVGDLGDDDHLAIALARELLDARPGPHHDAAAAGPVAEMNARAAVDVPCGREVRALDAQPTCVVVVLHEVIDGELGVAHETHRGVDHLTQIVGRDVGGHADGDAARAIDQQVRNPARQNERLTFGVVEVWAEVYGFFFDIGEELRREPGHPDLGVTHRRSRVAVD